VKGKIMRRREFITLLGGAASSSSVSWPLTARAQQPARMRRIGLLINTVENDRIQQANLSILREGLAKLGWIEGRNLRSELRWGAGDLDRLEDRARELVSLTPAVIVTDAGAATRAAQRATQTIPIVYMVGGDPAITGLVRNIARPEGNTTGFSNYEPTFAGKWLELLKEAVPRLTRVAVVFNPELLSVPLRSAYSSAINAAATTYAVQSMEMPIRDPIEIVRALDAFAAEANGGLIVLPTTAAGAGNLDAIIRMAAQHRLPAIYSGSRTFPAAGGLMAYGSKTADQYRRAASYIDRLLRGAKVSELPVQFQTRFELVINLKTAKAIGLTIPEAFLLRADELIE
jgi:putative tryptophan/tyrosine transport system substrate-binding protein